MGRTESTLSTVFQCQTTHILSKLSRIGIVKAFSGVLYALLYTSVLVKPV